MLVPKKFMNELEDINPFGINGAEEVMDIMDRRKQEFVQEKLSGYGFVLVSKQLSREIWEHTVIDLKIVFEDNQPTLYFRFSGQGLQRTVLEWNTIDDFENDFIRFMELAQNG